MGLFVGSWSYDFSLVVLHIISMTAFTCGPCSEVVFEFERRATYFGSLGAKLILAPPGTPNGSDPQ